MLFNNHGAKDVNGGSSSSYQQRYHQLFEDYLLMNMKNRSKNFKAKLNIAMNLKHYLQQFWKYNVTSFNCQDGLNLRIYQNAENIIRKYLCSFSIQYTRITALNFLLKTEENKKIYYYKFTNRTWKHFVMKRNAGINQSGQFYVLWRLRMQSNNLRTIKAFWLARFSIVCTIARE